MIYFVSTVIFFYIESPLRFLNFLKQCLFYIQRSN